MEKLFEALNSTFFMLLILGDFFFFNTCLYYRVIIFFLFLVIMALGFFASFLLRKRFHQIITRVWGFWRLNNPFSTRILITFFESNIDHSSSRENIKLIEILIQYCLTPKRRKIQENLALIFRHPKNGQK